MNKERLQILTDIKGFFQTHDWCRLALRRNADTSELPWDRRDEATQFCAVGALEMVRGMTIGEMAEKNVLSHATVHGFLGTLMGANDCCFNKPHFMAKLDRMIVHEMGISEEIEVKAKEMVEQIKADIVKSHGGEEAGYFSSILKTMQVVQGILERAASSKRNPAAQIPRVDVEECAVA